MNLQQYENVLTEKNLYNFFYKAIFLIIAGIVCSIILFYVFNKLLEKINKNNTTKKTKEINLFTNMSLLQQKKELKKYEDIYQEQKRQKEEEKKIMETLRSMKYNIIVKEQDAETQKLSREARKLFTEAMQNKQLTRAEILGIKEMLQRSVTNDNKKYKNDAHCICTLLKHYSIEKQAIITVIKFIKNK